MGLTTDKILDVTLLEPRLKHPTIFNYFDQLGEGESFMLHNDHDPKPLYYQLRRDRGDIFNWEYQEEGPEWWKIKITKKKIEKKNTTTNENEEVLNATLLPPQYKHATIFNRFDELLAGESFILQNDHDPKPLYYQLRQTRGNIFNWEYLEEGPEWWRIRISIPANDGATAQPSTEENILNATILPPQYKHATIFQHFDELAEGQSFILKNDHDPKPLYYQLQQTRGDIFHWDYLEQGPHWWQIRITKKKGGSEQNSADENEDIFDATHVPHQSRHAAIFAKFGDLKGGENFILQNDHDPKPLYYQLQQIKGDVFDWEYLEQGPRRWRIRITKHKVSNTGSSHVNKILNVAELEPRLKHSTVFEYFNSLQPGESFVIHNDHDPKPLYYQLSSEHGNIYWEYMEEGPDLWEIRLGKFKKLTRFEETHDEEDTKSDDESANSTENRPDEHVLNVTLLEPKRKHPTIFETYDELEEGSSFVILNDHDPKPLYYQMLGELGNVFKWEYLEQGPKWWRVRLTKRVAGESDESMGEIAAKDLRKAEVFKKYGLDFSCGGKKSVKEAAQEKGLDVTRIEQDLQQVEKGGVSRDLNYNEWDPAFLSDFIVNTHHTYINQNLPEIRGYAKKVLEVHGKDHPELNKVVELVEKMNSELMAHLQKEERIVFPYIKEVYSATKDNKSLSDSPFETPAEPLNLLEMEHLSIDGLMNDLREVTDGYKLPEDACASYTLLYRMLDEFEDDMRLHIHLENNILFPKVMKLQEAQ